MSDELTSLNQIIITNDNTDEFLERKIKENEKIFENLEVNNNIENSQKEENDEHNNINESNKKIVSENKNENISVSEKNDNINKNDNLSEINIQLESKEKVLSKDSLKSNEKIRNDNSFRNSINTQSNTTNKTNDKTKTNKSGKNKTADYQLYKKMKNKKNSEKLINSQQLKMKKLNKNKLENDNKKSYKIIKDKVNLNLNTQYTTLFTDKNRKGNNLEEKRIQKRNNSYIFESRDKSKNKNNEKFNIIYQKFLEDEKKKNENKERMKRIKEEKEKKIYLYKPRINIKSKELVNKKRGNKEDFYTRQKKLMEQYKKKDEILKEKLRIEKENLIKNSIISQKYLENKEKNKYNNKYDYVKSKLFDWEEKQKTLNNISGLSNDEKEDNESENSKTVYKIRVKRNTKRVIDRLYKDDIEKRKYNLQILNKIYMPSFHPNLFENEKINRKYRSLSKDNYNKKKNIKSAQHFSQTITINDENEKEKKEDIINNEINDNNITELLRNRLFNKIKKQVRYKSEIKSNVIDDENIYKTKDKDNNSKNNKKSLYKYKKMSNSFVRQKKFKI